MASCFEEKLKEAGLARYTHLLLPYLFARFRHRPPAELEAAALLDEADNGSYRQYGWADALEAVDPQAGERARVEAWLKAFFAVVFPRLLLLCFFPFRSDPPRNTLGCR